LDPLTDNQKDKYWSDYFDAFDYDLLTSDDTENELFINENIDFLNFQNNLSFKYQNNLSYLNKSNEILSILNKLTIKYDSIINDTVQFTKKFDVLNDQKSDLSNFINKLNYNIDFLENLGYITRILNTPGSTIVRKQKFKICLEKLDDSLEFVENNPDFRDIDSYKIRFRSGMTKALTLIRNYIINFLKTLYNNLQYQLNNQSNNFNLDLNSNSITQDALLYTKFSSNSDVINDLSNEIIKRIENHQEYNGLLSDCYNQYFSIRSKLISSIISKNSQDLVITKKKFLRFSQSMLSYFVNIIRQEHELFAIFFAFVDDDDNNNNNQKVIKNEEQLTQWLQTLCKPLYDILKNRIYKVIEIKNLCDLIILLQKYYDFTESEDRNFSFGNEPSLEENEFNVDLGPFFQPIIQEAQSRLILRIEVYIDENIVRYKPTLEDLNIGNRKKASVVTTISSSAMNGKKLDFGNNEKNRNLFKGLYPPLSKAITLLSEVYQLVNSNVFDNLAHNIVHACIISLKDSYKIAESHIGKINSKLYLMENLLLLKSQIENFDIQFVHSEPSLDFSGLNSIFNKIKNGEFEIMNNGIVKIFRDSVPKFVNNVYDAKLELQTELRNVVHSFTEDIVEEILKGCIEINDIERDLKGESREKINQNNLQFKENIKSTFLKLKELYSIYINDGQIISFLNDGIQELIIQMYEKYHEELINKANELKLENRKTVLQEVMEVDTLISYISDVSNSIFDEYGYDYDDYNNDDIDEDEM
ncbi:Golgi transport complex subunit COG3 ASCRUDRAFT_28412, partial [Ascoidea rubescens DSM 1968]